MVTSILSKLNILGGLMLEVKNITIITKKGREIVRDLSFTLQAGDKLAIIGEEGNGKSTLIKGIYQKEWIAPYAIMTGEINKKGLKIGYLEQFLDPKWHEYLVQDYFLKEEPESECDYERYTKWYEIERIMNRLQWTEQNKEEKRIGTLSGGEKVKLQMAKILWNQPDVLLLDEPTNDLDIETLEWLESFLLSLSIPILFISHDEVLLERVANGILHLEQLENKKRSQHTLVHIGYDAYVTKREELIGKQEQVAKNEKREYEKSLEKYRRMYQQVESDLRNVSRQDPSKGRLLKKKMKSVQSVGKKLENKEITKRPYGEEAIVAKFHQEEEIHAKKVILSFSKDTLIIAGKQLSKHIELRVVGSEKIVIVGNNGCGKTTLLREIWEKMKERNDIKVGYMPQQYEDELPIHMSPIAWLKQEYTKEEETLARTYLGSMRFTKEEMEGTIGALSGGQKAKLLLVQFMMQKCNVLLLDEPTRNLSPLSIPIIDSLLREFQGAIISISHDRKYIDDVCDKVYVLDSTGLSLKEIREN